MAAYISPARALFLAWCWPGLGHRDSGMRRRGRFYMSLLVVLFVVGEVLARGGAVTYSEHPFYFVLGQWWCGGFALIGVITNFIVGGGGSRFETYEIGQLFVTTAIVLNLLVIVDLMRRIADPRKVKDR